MATTARQPIRGVARPLPIRPDTPRRGPGWSDWDVAKSHWSLRTLLGVALAVATLLPTLAVGGLLLNAAMQRAGADTALIASTAISALDRELRLLLDGHARTLRTLAATLPAAQAPNPSTTALLQATRAQQPALVSMAVVRPDGRLLAADPVPPGVDITALDVSDRDYYRAIAEGAELFVSDRFVGRGIGRAPIVALSVPARRAGVLVAIVQGALDLPTLSRFFTERAIESSAVLLLDRHGQPLLSIPPKADGTQQALSAWLAADNRTASQRMGDRIHVQTPTANGWTIAMSVPIAPARSSVGLPFADEWAVAAIVLIALGLAALASLALARRIILPLHLLGEYASRFDPESDALPVPPQSAYPPPLEIAALARQFRRVGARMLRNLRYESQLRGEVERVLAGREAEIRRRTDELHQRTAELERALNAAESADNAKTAFLATMSHELRTPLTSILGFTDRLLRCVLDAGGRRAAASVHDAAMHMLALINDLLDVARIESGLLRVEVQAFDPGALLREVIALQRTPIEQKGLRLQLDMPSALPRRLHSDPMRLRQILLNLLDNARRFTSAGSVTFGARVDADARRLYLDVVDTGCGIASDKIATLFNAFQQVDGSIARRHGGVGLGLYLSREFARRMGGDLICESTPAHGSRFTLALPLPAEGDLDLVPFQPVTPRAARHRPAVLPRLHGRVLVADDSEHNRELLRHYLDEMGITCDFAVDGEQALQRQLAGDYDLILMDLHMPVVSGLDATRMIRQLDDAIPIVAVTADLTARSAQEQRDAGISETIAKPIDPALLAECLRRHLGSAPVAPPEPPTPVARPDPTAALRVQMIAALHAEYAQPLRDADAGGDLERMRRIAHRLYGCAGSFGLCDLAEAARALELHLVACGDAPSDSETVRSLIAIVLHQCALLTAPSPAPANT